MSFRSSTRTRARETFTAEERQQLVEIGQRINQVRGNAKRAALIEATTSPEQRELMIRWVAYRLAGGR